MSKQDIGRREFGRRVALAAAVAPGAMATALRGQAEDRMPTQSSGHGTPFLQLNLPLAVNDAPLVDGGQAQPDPKPQQSDEADLVLSTIAARYPDKRLDKATLEAIRGDVQYHRLLSRAIATFPLKNSDSPAFNFSAWRAPSLDSK
jgi:hypothetical protein